MLKTTSFISLLTALSLPFSSLSAEQGDNTNKSTSRLPMQPITPAAAPTVLNGVNAFFTADFIYWKVQEDGLEISFQFHDVADSQKTSIAKPKFRGEPGFKVGFGLNLNHDNWDFYAQYTWIQSLRVRGSQKINLEFFQQNLNDMRGMWAPNGRFITNLLSAKARWDLHFNAIDFELGKNYFVSSFLKLRPFTGIKVTWQDQLYIPKYFDSNGGISHIRCKMDHWGLGLRSGMNSSWQISSTWSFYGNIALSGMWTGYKSTRKDQDTFNLNPLVSFLNTKNDFHTLKLVTEWGLGVRGEWWFKSDRYRLLVQAGWEEQLWLANNQLLNFFIDNSTVKRGQDMSLQGLDLKFRFDF